MTDFWNSAFVSLIHSYEPTRETRVGNEDSADETDQRKVAGWQTVIRGMN